MSRQNRSSSTRPSNGRDTDESDGERKDNDFLIGGIRTKSSNLTSRASKSWIMNKKCAAESMDFDEMESVVWRKHQLRRFFQDRGNWWTSSRRSTAYKWVLVVITGVTIGAMGYGVSTGITALSNFKFNTATKYLNRNQWANSFFCYMVIALTFAMAAGLICAMEPAAAGSGIPEIKAFLNGVNLNRIIRIKVLYAKVIGMILSVSSGLPLGKEGPMIHTGSIIGAAVSQGKTITFGFDTSWSKFQDLRNDKSKRDFVTFGAAAGVAAAFAAPIGGILFTLEEGASFWSTALTFRSFFCAMMTMLTVSILFNGDKLGRSVGVGFQFGTFEDTNYYMYELIIFTIMGVIGGCIGALFNHINERVTKLRMAYLDTWWKKLAELFVLVTIWSAITFIAPLMWQECTDVPTQTASWSAQQYDLLQELVPFQCNENQYNEVASLYFVDSDVAMQQLFHFTEESGTAYTTFSTGALLMFFIPYFFMAAITSGTFCPAGLFVPTLLSGATFGRLVGHILNRAFPIGISNSGTYSLIGAAAILGGMSRMTIAGAVIVLEACGNSTFLLPLMLTFTAARYAGNAINEPMYDMQIRLKEMPFLEGSLKTLGLLNYHPIAEVMATPVVTLPEVVRVSLVYELLRATSHNGFPVVNREGHLRGLILRKTLCALLKHKIFSIPVEGGGTGGPGTPEPGADGTASDTGTANSAATSGKTQFAPVATLFHDTLERNYPRFTKIEDIKNLTPSDLSSWIDVRPYMDTAPFSINESASVSRGYRFFRTMGLRHLVVLDGDHKVTGMLTRHDLTEHRLEHHWFSEGDQMQKFIVVDPADVSSYVYMGDDGDNGGGGGGGGAGAGAGAGGAGTGGLDRTHSNYNENNGWNSIQLIQPAANLGGGGGSNNNCSSSSSSSGGYVPPQLAVPPVSSQNPLLQQQSQQVSAQASSRAAVAKSKTLKEPKTMASV